MEGETNKGAVPEIRGNPKLASTKKSGQKPTIISNASQRGSRCQGPRSRGKKGKKHPPSHPPQQSGKPKAPES